MSYETILTEQHGAVGVITLNRPDAMNALNNQLIVELNQALDIYEANDSIGAIVLTGSDKAFAAGADIKEMKNFSYMDAYKANFLDSWEHVTQIRKPVIAAVAGFALGGGCELAMMCDFILAADTAQFGQPEINLGIFPGAGGTQRLTRQIGKSKSMEMILTGRMMGAEEAERSGLVARIVPADDLIADAIKTAGKIAAKSAPTVMMAKEAVNVAYEMSLKDGVHFERRMFHAVFATEDQKEGMDAFADKRKPTFRHQ